jgi:hypothetical protein
VVEFVLCTIQAGLSTVKAQRQDIKGQRVALKVLWGQKAEGLAYAKSNKEFLWAKAMEISERGYSNVDACVEVVELFMKIPNLGMVKASFVAQCLGFNVACIDSHNLKRLGLPPTYFAINKKAKPETNRKKVKAYVEFCQLEGSAYWWDTWCEYVAGNQANRSLDSADVVSRYHVECVTM